MFFSAFTNELDPTNENLFAFKSKLIEMFCFPDLVEEFRTVCLYESVNREYVESLIRSW
jgi:hypothetical protein